MTVRKDGTRIRGAKLTEEERAANKHVSFRLNNKITDDVRKMAKWKGMTQGAMMQELIIMGLRLEGLFDRAREVIIATDEELSEKFELEPGGTITRITGEDAPSDDECWRLIHKIVRDGLRDYRREYEVIELM